MEEIVSTIEVRTTVIRRGHDGAEVTLADQSQVLNYTPTVEQLQPIVVDVGELAVKEYANSKPE